MKKLLVNSRSAFTFDESVTKEYGEFAINPEYQTAALPSKFSFCLDDTMFISVNGNETITGLQFRDQVLADSYVPLDGHCAKVIYRDKEALRLLGSMWWNTFGGIRSPNRLDTINFFGSILSNHSTTPHTISFAYEFISQDNPIFMPYEASEISWSKYHDYALVFKKEFSDTFLRK